MSRQLFLCEFRHHMLGQVGPAYISNEEGVAGDEAMFFPVFINEQVSGAFHGMTRCMDHFYRCMAHFKQFSVFGNDGRVAGFGSWTKHHLGAGFFNQVEVPAYKVGMKVCFKNIFDRCIVFGSPVNVWLYFPQGVKNGGFAIAFNIIRSMGYTACVDLYYFYDYFLGKSR